MSQLPIHSQCSCGQQIVTFNPSKCADTLHPRRCDCQFCTQHNITYVSDPDGYAQIQSRSDLQVSTCGSEQAKFLHCASCNTLLGAFIPDPYAPMQGLITLNASLWPQARFSSTERTQLTELTPEQKLVRWKRVLTPCTLKISPNALFVYGTLQPNQSNHHHVSNVNGEWHTATIQAKYHAAGWGMTEGFPGMILAEPLSSISGSVLISKYLPQHWSRLDEFEGEEYERRPCFVKTAKGYVLAQAYFVKM